MTVAHQPDRSFDIAVVGAGVMGATTALFLARGGMRVALLDRQALSRAASGVNAGTLTLHMTRAQLIGHAIRGREMWLDSRSWLGEDVGAIGTHGLSLAFTEDEEALLRQRAAVRQQAGAPIEVISPKRALSIMPTLNPGIRAAAYCALDGHIPAYRVGRAYAAALRRENVALFEHAEIDTIDSVADGYRIGPVAGGAVTARRVVLASGAWLEPMLARFGHAIPIAGLVNQLVVTEPMRPVMNGVVSIANGLLSLKQFANGSVLIGGGWQGAGDARRGNLRVVPENLRGNVRLARHVLPQLEDARLLRIWFGLESETPDAMPLIGSLTPREDAYVIGCVHSGFTSGPYMGHLLARRILGEAVDLSDFDPARFLPTSLASGRPDMRR